MSETKYSRRAVLKMITSSFGMFLPHDRQQPENLVSLTTKNPETQKISESDQTLLDLRQISDLLNQAKLPEKSYQTETFTTEVFYEELAQWWNELRPSFLKRSQLPSEYSPITNLKVDSDSKYNGYVDSETCTLVTIIAPIVGEIPEDRLEINQIQTEFIPKNISPVDRFFRAPYVLAHEVGHVAQATNCVDENLLEKTIADHSHDETSTQILALEVMADAFMSNPNGNIDSKIREFVWLKNMQLTFAKAYLYARFAKTPDAQIPYDWIKSAREEDRPWLENLAEDIRARKNLHTISWHDYDSLKSILQAIRSNKNYIDGLEIPGGKVEISSMIEAINKLGFDIHNSEYQSELNPPKTGGL